MRRFTDYLMVGLLVATFAGVACEKKENPTPVPEPTVAVEPPPPAPAPANPAACRVTTAVGGGSGTQMTYDCYEAVGSMTECPVDPGVLPECVR